MAQTKEQIRRRIYRFIATHGQVSTDQLYSWMNVDIHTLHDILRVMRDEGAIASANGTWYRRTGNHARLP